MKTRNVIILLAIVLLGAWYITRDSELTPEEKYRERFGITDSENNEASEHMTDDDNTVRGEIMNAKGNGMTLTAQTVGNGTVELSWEVEETIIHTDSAKVYLLHGDKPEILHDKNTFWWRHHYTVTDASWDNIPSGERYFRACFAPEGDECTYYSDAIMLEVR